MKKYLELIVLLGLVNPVLGSDIDQLNTENTSVEKASEYCVPDAPVDNDTPKTAKIKELETTLKKLKEKKDTSNSGKGRCSARFDDDIPSQSSIPIVVH